MIHISPTYLAFVGLFALFISISNSAEAQFGRQDLTAIEGILDAEKIYVVIGTKSDYSSTPNSFFAEFKAAFEETWDFGEYEVVTITKARELGRDTNLYFLQLSHVLFNKRQGAMVILTKGFKQVVMKLELPGYQRKAIAQFTKWYVQWKPADECQGHTCQKESFYFLIRSMKSYLETSLEIENASFEAVAWANREKLKNTEWYLSEKSLAPELKEEGVLEKECPTAFRIVDLTEDKLLELDQEVGAESIGIIHFSGMMYGGWELSLISLSGDLLFHLPQEKGTFAFVPKVNSNFMEELNRWLELSKLEDW